MYLAYKLHIIGAYNTQQRIGEGLKATSYPRTRICFIYKYLVYSWLLICNKSLETLRYGEGEWRDCLDDQNAVIHLIYSSCLLKLYDTAFFHNYLVSGGEMLLLRGLRFQYKWMFLQKN